MEVGDEETEFGVVQVFGQVADGDAVLAVVAGVTIGGATDPAEASFFGEGTEAEHDAVAADGGEVIG